MGVGTERIVTKVVALKVIIFQQNEALSFKKFLKCRPRVIRGESEA